MHVFVKSFGCSTNLADGEVLAGCLLKAGHKLVDSALEADVLIYNMCAVKGPTENRAIATLKCAPKGKKVIVAGCLPLINFERLNREVHLDAAIRPAAGDTIADVVNRVFAGEKVVDLEGALKGKPGLSLPQLRTNPVLSIIPVCYGCLGSCAYCCVVFARGRLRSYPVNEVIKRVRNDLAAGAQEFWITSQDMACYGRDIGTNLAELLVAINAVQGDFRVRVGMMTPNFVSDILNDLIEAFRNEKVFKFVHLPVQSGDDEILRSMKRFYSVQDFREVINEFRAVFPNVTVATDIILGFPDETRAAFNKTMNLIEQVKPDVVNVSKFFGRPGTAAAEMHEAFLEPAVIKRRSVKASKIVKQISLERNQRWVGWTGEALVDEKGKVPKSWIGRNFAYKPIALKSSTELLGKKLQVKIEKVFSTYLVGTAE